MTPVQLPIVPIQSVPPLDTRGGDPTLPPLFARAWWLFFSALVTTLNGFNEAIAALVTAIAGKQNAMKSSVQANLSTFSSTLKVGDLVNVTDYRHVLQWSGTTYAWGPGEDGRHDIAFLPIDPDDTTGWQLCDGSTVNYLLGDGTAASFATPNLTGSAAYMKLGAAVSGPNAAVAPTFTGSAVTSGVNSASNSFPIGAGITNTVAQHTHTHSVTAAGTVSNTGEPRNYVVRGWFRR